MSQRTQEGPTTMSTPNAPRMSLSSPNNHQRRDTQIAPPSSAPHNRKLSGIMHAASNRSSISMQSNMRTNRVRSIAAAERGSTLLLNTCESVNTAQLTLPWASLLSTNSQYPSVDIKDDAILIGRRAPANLKVSHMTVPHAAISAIHCRLYRKVATVEDQSGKDVIALSTSSNESSARSSIVGDSAIGGGALKRYSQIKTSDVTRAAISNINYNSALDQSDEGESTPWKGTKNQLTLKRASNSVHTSEVWLEDLSTNGTFINGSKIGHGQKVRLTSNTEFTLLPANAQGDRISFVLQLHGETPVGDTIDDAPSDTVTLVFTDIESSTTLWAAAPTAMNSALEDHDRIIRTLLTRFRGYEVKTEGDAFMVAFFTVLDAVKWCLAVQEALLRWHWPEALLQLPQAQTVYSDETRSHVKFSGLRVRMGIHTGKPNCRRNPTTKRMDYFGPVVNLSARVSDAAYGGQIVCTDAVYDVLQGEVSKEKERAEREWEQEKLEDELDNDDIDEECESEADDVVHCIDSRLYTPPQSTGGTGDENTFKSIAQLRESAAATPQQAASPPHIAVDSSSKSPNLNSTDELSSTAVMESDKFNRIRAGVNKKPSTLDDTLSALTALSSVTLMDCHQVQLKGIPSLTHVYQISSLSLIHRRWTPSLRVKQIVERLYVDGTAPAPPPCTITLYDKSSVPLQIRRQIMATRKSSKIEANRELQSAISQTSSKRASQISVSHENNTQQSQSLPLAEAEAEAEASLPLAVSLAEPSVQSVLSSSPLSVPSVEVKLASPLYKAATPSVTSTSAIPDLLQPQVEDKPSAEAIKKASLEAALESARSSYILASKPSALIRPTVISVTRPSTTQPAQIKPKSSVVNDAASLLAAKAFAEFETEAASAPSSTRPSVVQPQLKPPSSSLDPLKRPMSPASAELFVRAAQYGHSFVDNDDEKAVFNNGSMTKYDMIAMTAAIKQQQQLQQQQYQQQQQPHFVLISPTATHGSPGFSYVFAQTPWSQTYNR